VKIVDEACCWVELTEDDGLSLKKLKSQNQGSSERKRQHGCSRGAEFAFFSSKDGLRRWIGPTKDEESLAISETKKKKLPLMEASWREGGGEDPSSFIKHDNSSRLLQTASFLSEGICCVIGAIN